jgi:outer membrane murein-binding lipoprotein Lpp
MSVDISELMSESSFWEIAGYWATGIVTLGVAGEAVTELTNCIKSRPLKRFVERASALILILGLAGEILTQVQAGNKNALIIGILNTETARLSAEAEEAKKEIAHANAIAAQANQRAASLQFDLERQIEKSRARTLNQSQWEALSEMKGSVPRVNLGAQNSVECRNFASQIRAALEYAGVKVDEVTFPVTRLWQGVAIFAEGASDITVPTDPFSQAMIKAHLTDGGWWALDKLDPGVPRDAPTIFVGERLLETNPMYLPSPAPKQPQ